MTNGHSTAPLPEEYSRVTNPERFAPLHDLALALASRLRERFEVRTREAFELMPGHMRPFEHARSPLTLTPATSDAAPIAIAFTNFPSLRVRCGRWLVTSFPACGCDACRETAASEGARLEELVGDVIVGRFAEELTIPLFRSAHVRWRLGDASVGHTREGGSIIRRDVARMLAAAGTGHVQWQAWPSRSDGAAVSSAEP